MKTLFGALALILAVPAVAQSVPATNPHAGHTQHKQSQQGGGQQTDDHAKMMDDCKKAMADGKCEEHCKAMMEKHAAAAKAATAPEAHAGHAH
jgi:hypothetical protein